MAPLKQRIKERRITALENLKRRIADKKHWLLPSGEAGDGKRLAVAEAEAAVLEQRIQGHY